MLLSRYARLSCTEIRPTFERPRILVWLFKPAMRLSYATPTHYALPPDGTVRGAKVLFKLIGPFVAASEMPAYVLLLYIVPDRVLTIMMS